MRPLGSRLLVCLSLSSLIATVFGQDAKQPFEIREGDRVLFLGDTLLEREGTYGYLETRMHEQFTDRRFTVRNLSYSADTPHGISRSVFDPADKGWERLKEQIAMVKPTVVFLGYGMASSLDFVGSPTDRMAEPKRSTEEKVTRFRKEMEELMDAIVATDPSAKVRFVLLSPIRHEDLRAESPALPDPKDHNQALAAITQAASELAKSHGATFVDAFDSFGTKQPNQQSASSLEHFTYNGIHLTEPGHSEFSRYVADQLGWQKGAAGPVGVSGSARPLLQTAIQHKNELFFHRWRPENQTYLFGFRKHEQGQNAKEIPMFDPLIDAGEAEIDRIKRGASSSAPSEATAHVALPANAPAQPQPQFDVQDGYEISLWAENPLLEKPIQMNWDAQGRLWIASSSVYPQIEPGAPARDRILLLEDTDRDGRADKSSVFAEGLLIPTAVIANVVSAPDAGGKAKGTSCYVGQSTELLQLTDTDGDGKADKRESVLSGFGTEDTHHIVHTLRWGPDGRLYFDQSIYIHSHIETPWGVVRQNSGGVFAWDPRSQKLEVMYNGFWNPWGVAWDKAGEAFITDGAGFQGISWGIRGAAYQTYEGSRRLLQSISPGSYPKFCGLEMVSSPHFPQDWQNSLVTCDFRAHRVVHFGVNELSTGENPTSGYITKELPDIVRTSDVSFRPIDVKMGPDGALYIADWSNPVINHGEVDFRDPRRDKTHGRIWRITKKNTPLVQWHPLIAESTDKLKTLVRSASAWESQQATKLLVQAGSYQPKGIADKTTGATQIADSAPRARVHAMRALARDLSAKSAELVLEAALKAPANDPFYDYAAWLSINDLVEPWSKAVLSGEWKIDSPAREKQLQWALNAIDPSKASPIVAKLMETRAIQHDGSGPWIELIGKSGNEGLLTQLFDKATTQQLDEAATLRALDALTAAARLRNLRPATNRTAAALPLLSSTKSEALQIRLAKLLGAWKEKSAIPALLGLLESEMSAGVSDAAGQALAEIGGAEVSKAVADVAKRRADDKVVHMFENAVQTLAQLDPKQAAPFLSRLFARLPESNKEKLVAVWRDLLKIKGGADLWATLIPADLSRTAATAGVRAAREQGKKGEKLATALSALAGANAEQAKPTQDYAALAELTKRDGDPSRGEEIYRRAQVSCVTCHAIGGAGGKVGPELTSLGASAPLDYIIESVLNPAAKVKEGFHAVNLTLKDGTVASGIQSRESAEEVFLRNVIGQETAVPKANIAGKENIGSIMPAGLVDALQPRERLDLFAFLSQLGKPGVYDASKGTVARVWKLLPGSDLENVASGNANLAAASNAFTNVDGRLSREQLQSALQLLPNATDSVVAVSRFQQPTAGRTNLTFTGVSKAWLDGKPLAVASEPKVSVDLPAGEHVIAVKLDPKQLPQTLRAESQDVRFLTE